MIHYIIPHVTLYMVRDIYSYNNDNDLAMKTITSVRTSVFYVVLHVRVFVTTID